MENMPPVFREGCDIVLNDGFYPYYCDLDDHNVEWWIAHVSEKNWWKPEWAAQMRALAKGLTA